MLRNADQLAAAMSVEQVEALTARLAEQVESIGAEVVVLKSGDCFAWKVAGVA
ncbi:hypothetical protein [Ferrimonas pelagia]|uniref:Uncharacterized protein n=1 Tax=Ferrimonas pelagia TaxID=1177826 RepID=A0ABP9F3E1_9GAMM